MDEFIAFQAFLPREAESTCCVWCGLHGPFNRAHVVSRKLDADLLLKKSVCIACNSNLGKLEEWVLRYSPLGWARFFFHLQSNVKSSSTAIPSYFWSPDLSEWIAYFIEGHRRTRTIPAQFIIGASGSFLIAESSPDDALDAIVAGINKGGWRSHISNSLPTDFAPRVLLEGERTLVIARDHSEVATVSREIELYTQRRMAESVRKAFVLAGTERIRQHFKFSRENWVRFCAKIAFEALCLVEGVAYCRQPTFDTVRSYVKDRPIEQGREVVFDERGPLPPYEWFLRPSHVDMTVTQSMPERLWVPLAMPPPGCHLILLYEVEGWVCASISVSGFPPTFLCLGGPNAHLMDFYQIVYDNEEDAFHFLRLAHDSEAPVIPMPISGDNLAPLLGTYRLRPEDL